MTYRAVDLEEGRAYIVSDLHGEWEPYIRYRDHFLYLRSNGMADYLIFLGDVIHSYGPEEEDYSLHILWDIMQLQAQLGPDVVIMLLGNHELPHIYSITLSKGERDFTARFEYSLGEYRASIIDFLKSLPFCVRTRAGVMLTHAGAAERTANQDVAAALLNFSHDALLSEAERMLHQEDMPALVERTLKISPKKYLDKARQHLAISGPEDPRYFDLLRGVIASHLEPEWPYLWDYFFTYCEEGLEPDAYENIVRRFLAAYSPLGMPQQVLVSGHISVRGGYHIVNKRHLRIASWSHALPREEGCYLLIDTAKQIHFAGELVSCLYRAE